MLTILIYSGIIALVLLILYLIAVRVPLFGNSLAFLFEMQLTVPVYGWFGGFKGMLRSGGGKSKRNDTVEKAGSSRGLPGGATQFYIPNLTLGLLGPYTIKPTESWS